MTEPIDPINTVKEITDLALRSTEPTDLADGIFAFAVPEGGTIRVEDLRERLELSRPSPARMKGSTTQHDLDSWAMTVQRFATDSTCLYADAANAKFTAVFNDHAQASDELAGWRDHRAVLGLRLSAEWLAWMTHSGGMLDQMVLAHHIEMHLADIVEPEAADLLELVQSIEASIGSTFKSSDRLDNGQRQLIYTEEMNAKAGTSGQMRIPASITLRLRPYEGCSPISVEAKFRFRITKGELKLGYELVNPARVLADAFDELVVKAASETGIFVIRGCP